MIDQPNATMWAADHPWLQLLGLKKKKKKSMLLSKQLDQGWDAPTSRGGCSLLGSQEPEPGALAREPEPKRPQERRGPAALGPAGAAEAEAGAAGARWGCLKEIYNHFLSVVW